MKQASFADFPDLQSAHFVAAQISVYQHGTVVRMHMGDCILAHHGFMVAFGGPSTPMEPGVLP